jgi:hypothetical protein
MLFIAYRMEHNLARFQSITVFEPGGREFERLRVSYLRPTGDMGPTNADVAIGV